MKQKASTPPYDGKARNGAGPNGAGSSVAIRLNHAAIVTTRLDDAVAFYTGLLGLSLRIVEEDPIRRGRRRAMLTDHQDGDVLEIIEMQELGHPTIPGRGALHHLGFCLPRREWHALRSRLDAGSYAYQEIDERLFVRDQDGLVLEIEQAG